MGLGPQEICSKLGLGRGFTWLPLSSRCLFLWVSFVFFGASFKVSRGAGEARLVMPLAERTRFLLRNTVSFEINELSRKIIFQKHPRSH